MYVLYYANCLPWKTFDVFTEYFSIAKVFPAKFFSYFKVYLGSKWQTTNRALVQAC